MLIEARIIYEHYNPGLIRPGMLFQKRRQDDFQVFELTEELYDKNFDGDDDWIEYFGYPFHIKIAAQLDSNPDVEPTIVATLDQIGWVDYDDDLYAFTIDDLNYMLREDDGWVGIFVEEDEIDTPELHEGKAVITPYSALFEEDEYDEENLY